MQNVPWLSVILPTYNGAAYLPAALDSVGAQGDPNIEVIAVDDGSTDKTPAVLDSFADRLRMTILRRRIRNWVANSNLGLEHARGEWACLLHQDDFWNRGRLAAIRKALRRARPSPSASDGPSLALGLGPLILTAAEFVTSAGRRVGTWRCPLSMATAGNAPAHVAERLLVQNFVPLPGAVFRRADAVAVGGLDEKLWYTADWDLWLKLAARGPTRYLPRPLAAFRLHPESQTVRRSGGIADFRRQHEIVFERHWPIWRDRLADPDRVESAARLSIETNLLLASLLHRGGLASGVASAPRGSLAAATAGLSGAMHFVNSSRILERVSARIRAGLLR